MDEPRKPDLNTTFYLVRRAKSGEQAALGELFARYYPRVRKIVRLRLGEHLLGVVDATDILQETFVAAIKTEVVLSFLGLGTRGGVSWGMMIAESTQDILAGHFNSFMAGSVFLFVTVIAFNLFSDTVQDALDPKKDQQ